MNTHEVLSSIGLRINALTGVTSATQETAYTTRPLTTAQFQSTIFPFSAIKRAQLIAEKRLSEAIANVGGHPWRQYFADQTAALAHKAQMPSLSASSKQIIGIWGSVFDATDGIECTEQEAEAIRRRNRNANSFFRTPAYSYKIDG